MTFTSTEEYLTISHILEAPISPNFACYSHIGDNPKVVAAPRLVR